MKRLLPHPLLALGILLMWLLLTASLSPGQLVLGAIVAVLGSHAMAALQPEDAGIRSVRPIPRLAAIVFADIVRSNVAVARIVLLRDRPERVSGFVRLPLDMRSRYGLTVLACIITATPGTIWVEFDRRANVLVVHVLDLVDPDAWIRETKHRYERPLMEIFG
ncbi:Na+/H+ antiporter subunit E [Sphingomonas sp. MAH-20]|uniref:Na+/H+ antiporter subunit E n=1 Tax=Sphingomonas horti TaxID=2682842 RepID=A0A6I4IYN9_9SPHN|nr:MULTISPECIES: Na+/H+ antiporter subunit E [Sphingomonas]MBA2918057.1 Na+/H+ antiporter subunit E [Sphingomonas sp. CGMCC 1.13658]MVO77028.1 Na+/H+ antiporter subunit E [Sphingomonas horti]